MVNKIPLPLSLPTSSLCFQEFLILRGFKLAYTNSCILKAWFCMLKDFRDQYLIFSLPASALNLCLLLRFWFLPALCHPIATFLWNTEINRICISHQPLDIRFVVFIYQFLAHYSVPLSFLVSYFLCFLLPSFLCPLNHLSLFRIVGGVLAFFSFVH